jgi:hypothetical protein
LKTAISKNLSIPINIASDLLEKLSVDKLIYDGVKTMDNGTKKTSILLTKEASRLLDESVSQVAVSEEEKEK